MLILHIGSQKTGTTAIQNYLKQNQKPLARQGYRFIRAGRTNIAHNSMIGAMRRGDGPAVFAQIVDEIRNNPAQVHILSSEMFFRKGIAQHFADQMPDDLRSDTRVICYLRRPDKYLEAMYKQHVKNGRIDADPAAFLDRKMSAATYGPVLDEYAAVFGANRIGVRPFERDRLIDRDAVSDFAQATGLPRPGQAPAANPSLSIEVSEVLGLINRHTSFNTREIIRQLSRSGPKSALRSNDVFDTETRRRILAHCANDTEMVRSVYRPQDETLFSTDDLARDARPATTDPAARYYSATAAVMAAIGALETSRAEAMRQP